MVLGGAEGLKLLLTIAPSLVTLLCATEMLRASGALDQLTELLSPVCSLLGLPAETLPLMLVRPFSGSAALAVGAELMAHYGVDSQIGRTAAVMLGSTETTFYTITVYFGAAGVKRTRHTILAALAADLTGFLCAALFTRLF
jgi:spore maturation protein B